MTTAWHLRETRESTQLEASVERLQREVRAAQAAAASGPAGTFITRLPTTVSIDPIVSQFQQAAAGVAVAFVSVSAINREASAESLGRTQLSVTLRGSYANLTTVIGETFDRYPGLLLERLTLRRVGTPAEVEARVDLLLVTQPRPAGAGGPSR